MLRSLVGSEMCIRDRARLHVLMDSTIGPADQQLDPLSFLDNK